MRDKFNEQLERLNLQLIQMGALCEEAISAAAKALLEGDQHLMQSACAAEQEIDQRERDIESLCLNLLLKQQPVAKDLRTVSAAMRMIADMERIGDQAADIAEIARDIENRTALSHIPIAQMARQAVSMVTDSVDSFVRKDLQLAQSVIQTDDQMDQLFLDIRRELIRLIGCDSEKGETCLDLLMVAKYFERIGDHAVNIAEWVEFSITGQHKSL